MSDRKTDNIVTRTRGLQREIQSYKSVQPLGGASFVNYTTFSNSNYDFSRISSGVYQSYRLTFTYSEPEGYHIMNPSLFFRIDNPDVMDDPYLSTLNQEYFINIIGEEPQSGYNSWIVDLSNVSGVTHTFYVKAFFTGTTSGSFNLSAIL